jgi:hypothetical protein
MFFALLNVPETSFYTKRQNYRVMVFSWLHQINWQKKFREVGDEYCEELKDRSFFDGDLFLTQFKLHDIIYDLARLNSEREHCAVEINRTNDIKEVNIPQEVLHLYVRGSCGSVNEVIQQNLKGLRTLSMDLNDCRGQLILQHWIKYPEIMDFNLKMSELHSYCIGNIIYNLTNFAALRVLEMKGDCLRDIPDSIAQLKHLTLLRITSDEIECLPDSICLLYNLRILILDCILSPLEDLPESIGYLANLQYLCIRCANFKKLPNSFFLLGNLLRLEIENEILLEVPSDSRKLSNLQELIIHVCKGNYTLRNEIYVHNISALPELLVALASCPKLEALEITGCCVNYNPHGLKSFPAMRTMVAHLIVRTIGWLKDIKDVEGHINIEGLENISNLVDAQHANLSSKCKIETLYLQWHIDDRRWRSYDSCAEELRIRLIKKPYEGEVVGEMMNFSLLECLQPHPHLKRLRLEGYPCATVPCWLGDPSSLQSIQKIILRDCGRLQSLPFSNLHTLKHLEIWNCSGIQLLLLEQLPSQLENLTISRCEALELITGLRNLQMLVALFIIDCETLKSITMDEHEPQLVESTEPFANSYHEKPCDCRQSTSSLTKLKIYFCPLLHFLPSELIPYGPCDVRICDCGSPDLYLNFLDQ